MARIGSIAIGGYYAFPPALLPAVARHLDLTAWTTPDRAPGDSRNFVAFDPCAGEGVALLQLLQHGLGKALDGADPAVQLRLFGCELETRRARRTRHLWNTALPAPHQSHVIHSDIFRVQIPRTLEGGTPGAHLGWVNPPYDQDPEFHRLEERFLRWITPLLCPGAGVLCFVLPHHAVAASAQTLATEYEHLQVYRLPDVHYVAFKQVIVFGQRRVRPCTLPALIDAEIARLHTLTADDAAPPVLADNPATPPVAVPRINGGLPRIAVAPVDTAAIQTHIHLWTTGTATLADPPGPSLPAGLTPFAPVGAHLTLADFYQATHPCAMPPLPTHTAQILASGLVNGQMVRPDCPERGLPPIIITGHFRRVTQVTDTNHNANGEVTSYKMEEKPRLRIDLLALTDPPAFYTLKEGTEPSGTTDLAEMNAADFLEHYGRNLANLIQGQFPALHDPANPDHQLPLPGLQRPLFPAQSHAVCALLKIAAVRGENPFLHGEPGVGKTAMFLNLALALTPTHLPTIKEALICQFKRPVRLRPVKHTLIVCPPHLLDNWEREIRRVLPGARVRRIERISDFRLAAPPPPFGSSPLGQDLTFDILSREMAKLTHGYSHKAPTGFPVAPRHQVLADLFRAARLSGLTSLVRVTQHLRTTTDQADLTLQTATLDDLRRTLAALPNPPTQVRCSRCGTLATEDVETLIASRARCTHRPLVPAAPLGPLLRPLAALLAPFYPDQDLIHSLHRQPAQAATREARPFTAWTAAATGTATSSGVLHKLLLGAPSQPAAGLVSIILQHYQNVSNGSTRGLDELLSSLVGLVCALPAVERNALTPQIVTRLYAATTDQRKPYGGGAAVRRACCILLAVLPDATLRQELIATLRPSIALETGQYHISPWDQLARTLEHLAYYARQLAPGIDPALRAQQAASYPSSVGLGWRTDVAAFPELGLDTDTGAVTWDRHPVGTPAPAWVALQLLTKITPFRQGEPCGEPLVQAIPEPRRFALSRYILKRHRRQYQLLALDEAHEANNAERAQSQAYYRLAMLPGVLTIPMSGTPMNGYASSIFSLWWHLNRGFRRQFRRTERERFSRIYGYRRLLKRVEDPKKPADTGRRLRGRNSDAIVGGTHVEVIGEAPGIAPSALLFILPDSVPIHLTHLEQVLPPREQQRPAVTVNTEQDPTGAEMLATYQKELRKLVDLIRESLRDEDLAGKLWGFLPEFGLGYPILCSADVGNGLDSHGQPQYRFTYPRTCGSYGGQVLLDLPLFPAAYHLPHETALLDLVRQELAERRNVIIYLRHTGTPRLAQRLMRLLSLVTPSIYLDVSRVPAPRRDAWITQHVLQRRIPVLITNPEAVKTGLNNLTPYFKTAVWLEPTLNTATFRQAGARLRRIGSHPTDPIRDILICYKDTAQQAAVELILQKVHHSELFDGLDLQSSLAAAGVQEDDPSFLIGNATASIGKALYDHLRQNDHYLRALPFTRTIPVATVPAILQQRESSTHRTLDPPGKHGAVQLSFFD